MTNFLLIGIVLGLSAGFAPGPLLTLIISETLRHDIKAGIKVALAPMITDLPIIVLTLLILAKLSDFHNVLGIISLIGGCFILFIGYESIRSKGVELEICDKKPKSLTKGILANFLSPHPYLFWFSVGAPIMTKAITVSYIAPLLFAFGFYASLVGSKIVLAVLVGKSKTFLKGNSYIYAMRTIGAILCFLALVLFKEGLKLLGWI